MTSTSINKELPSEPPVQTNEISPSTPSKTFAQVTKDNNTKMTEKSSFLHLKYINDNKNNISDDVTVDNTSSAKLNSQRMTIMFTVPKLEEDASPRNRRNWPNVY